MFNVDINNLKEQIKLKLESSVKPSKETKSSFPLLDITQNNMTKFDDSILEVGDQVIFKSLGIKRGIIKRVSLSAGTYNIGICEDHPWGEYKPYKYSDINKKNILGYKKSN